MAMSPAAVPVPETGPVLATPAPKEAEVYMQKEGSKDVNGATTTRNDAPASHVAQPESSSKKMGGTSAVKDQPESTPTGSSTSAMVEVILLAPLLNLLW